MLRKGVPGSEENDMRESIQRVRGRWRFNVSEISVAQTEAAQSATPTFVRAILKVSR